MLPHFILYVQDQDRSRVFYERVLANPPRLNVPGMTEFELGAGAVLGIMPETNIAKLLGGTMPDPRSAAGIPRAELYLLVSDPAAVHRRALAAGATELSALASRSWGHVAAYSLDLDGHVLAVACVAEAARAA